MGVCLGYGGSQDHNPVSSLNGCAERLEGSISLVGRWRGRGEGAAADATERKASYLHVCLLLTTRITLYEFVQGSALLFLVCQNLLTGFWHQHLAITLSSFFFHFPFFSLYNTFSFFKTLLEDSFINVILQLLTTS